MIIVFHSSWCWAILKFMSMMDTFLCLLFSTHLDVGLFWSSWVWWILFCVLAPHPKYYSPTMKMLLFFTWRGQNRLSKSNWSAF
jgi:hypothetical protein